MKPYLFIVEASFLGVNYIIEAANKLGFSPIILSNLTSQEGDALREITSSSYIQCNTEDSQEIVKIIKHFGKSNTAGAITFLDSRLQCISDVCHTLDINGIEPAILNLKDKNTVNTLVQKHVPKSISFNLNDISIKDLKKFVQTNPSAKYVAKPRFAAGARGYFEFKIVNEFFSNITKYKTSLPNNCIPNEYLIQTHYTGELISIEGYICNGDIIFWGASGRRKIKNTESACLFPYEQHMPKNTYHECCEIIQKLLKRSGVKNSCFHIEFIVNKGTVKLIDANIGRPPGGNLVEVIAHSYGLNIETLFAHILSVQIKHKPEISADFFRQNSRQVSLGLLYGLPKAAQLFNVTTKEILQSSHHIAVNPGVNMPPMGESNWSIIGTLAGNVETVLNDLKKLEINTSLGKLSPKYATFEEELFYANCT